MATIKVLNHVEVVAIKATASAVQAAMAEHDKVLTACGLPTNVQGLRINWETGVVDDGVPVPNRAARRAKEKTSADSSESDTHARSRGAVDPEGHELE